MKNIPDKIYIQVGEPLEEDADFKELETEAISWCQDRVFETDLEYLSLQEVKSLIAKAVKITKGKAIELYYENEADADIDNLIRNIDVQEIVNEIFPKK